MKMHMSPQSSRDVYNICRNEVLAHAARPQSLRFLNAANVPTAVATTTPGGQTQISVEVDIATVDAKNRPHGLSANQCLVVTDNNRIRSVSLVPR